MRWISPRHENVVITRRTTLAVFRSLAIAGIATAIPTHSQTVAVPGKSFDVASVKRVAPPSGDRLTVIMRAEKGVLTYSNVTLRDLLLRAFRLRDFQLSGEKWVSSERFEIIAKYSSDTPKDQVPDLLQNLLRERFKLRVHQETRIMPIYSLIVARGGTKLTQVFQDSGLHLSFTAEGVRIEGESTLTRLAEVISQSADRPVFDFTDLQGVFAVKLEWSSDNRSSPLAGIPAVDVNGPPLFTALREQLGLKVQPRKGPVAFLVVDHAEKYPTEN